MNNRELNLLQKCLQFVPDESLRDKALVIVLNAAAESIKYKNLQDQSKGLLANGIAGNSSGGKIQFTIKELYEMPESIKRLFIINERVVNYRIVRGMYQIRFHRDGYNIEVASKSLEDVKKKFLEKLAKGPDVTSKQSKYPLMKDFVQKWLEYKKPTIKNSSYVSYSRLANGEILPVLGDMRIDEITREVVQNFLNKLVEDDKLSTALNCKTILGAIFDLAVEDYEIKDPMNKVVLPHYEPQKGSALTKEDEKTLLTRCEENPKGKVTISALIVLLYTGMRVGELKSMTHDDKFVYCISEKTRKGYADVTRKIPISPMFRKYEDLLDLDYSDITERKIEYEFKLIFPEHHVHELRYTFITRAKECGINPELIMLMDGHKRDHEVMTSKVDRGYTDYSEEYLLKEMLKFDYEL